MKEDVLYRRNGDSTEADEVLKPKLNPEFIKNLQGKDFVLYSGLLDLAHQKGLIKLEVEIIQYPSKDNGNSAICIAKAETKSGEVFTDIGDASPQNTNKVISSHILRMASTRAKARALRDLTNIGMTCLEELGDMDDVMGAKKAPKRENKPPKAQTVPTKPQGKGAENAPSQTPNPEQATDSNSTDNETPKRDTKKPETKVVPMSDAQRRAMFNLAKRRGISEQELEDMVKEQNGSTIDDLTNKEASAFIRHLQQAA